MAAVTTSFPIRDARATDVAPLADLWFEGWQDAHAAILPEAWRRARTRESFAARLHAGLATVRMAPGAGAPLGFTMVRGDELDQFFVARAARGGGVAMALMVDVLASMRGTGIETAWLVCAIGNDRAARFYERQGWRRAGTVVREIAGVEGTVRAPVWRYEIDL